MAEKASSPLWTIGLGTLSISTASGIFTGAYSIYRNKPDPGLLTGAAAINSGATAFVFFGCREYAAGPLLTHFAPGQQYARRRKESGIGPLSSDESLPLSPTISWADLRWNKLLDSGLSGAVTGGVLRGMRSGPKAIFPGAFSVGVACTVLQYGFNELSITRLRYVSDLQRKNSTEKPAETLTPGSEGAFQSLMKLFGLIPVSDEEYLAKLKNSRDLYIKRIAELEAQVEEEKILKEMTERKDS